MSVPLTPPGEFIREEMEARGWAQSDFAEVLGKSEKLVSEVLASKRPITHDTAIALGSAFGTSSQFWINLESSYRLSLSPPDSCNTARLADEAKTKAVQQ